MRNVSNSVQLIGNLGRDPEMKELTSGKKLTRATIATTETYKSGEGEPVKDTQWHNLVAWGKTAELMARLLNKGHRVVIQGKLTHRTYENEEGVTRHLAEIVVKDFLKLTKNERLPI